MRHFMTRCDIVGELVRDMLINRNKPKAFPWRRVLCGFAQTYLEDARRCPTSRPVRFGSRFRIRGQHNSIGRSSSTRPTTQRRVNTRQKGERPAWQTRRDAPNKSEYVPKVTGCLFATPFDTVKSQNSSEPTFSDAMPLSRGLRHFLINAGSTLFRFSADFQPIFSSVIRYIQVNIHFELDAPLYPFVRIE